MDENDWNNVLANYVDIFNKTYIFTEPLSESWIKLRFKKKICSEK